MDVGADEGTHRADDAGDGNCAFPVLPGQVGDVAVDLGAPEESDHGVGRHEDDAGLGGDLLADAEDEGEDGEGADADSRTCEGGKNACN